MSNPRIVQNNGQRLYLKQYAPPGGGGITQLTGDVLTGIGGGVQAATLNAINSNVGFFGSGTQVPVLQVDAKGRILSVSVAGIPGLTGTSMPKASDVGILANGSDQTANLNTVFGNANYQGIIMDFVGGGSVTISGTVNCGGKMIYFQPGSKFTGVGTIDNCVIAAGYRQKCFDTTVNITNSQTSSEYFSAMWYGAAPTVGNDSPAIQKSIDTVIANTLMQTVYIPGGAYNCDDPITAYKWDGTNYVQHSVNLIGDGKFWQGSVGGTKLTFSFTNTYGFGIQNGKGNIVQGILFKGGFTPPAYNGGSPSSVYIWYTKTASAFTDGVSRDSTFSPYAGLCIDPFSPSVPADGGYPGLTSFYRGAGGNAGTTGTNVFDCIFSNFVVGMITSPNGFTANAELMNWNQIQFANLKYCVVGCQDQEKLNVVRYTACWANSFGFFNSGDYGAGSPGNWVIEGVNIAGQMNELIHRHSGGFFPLHVSYVYAEGLGKIGDWTSGVGDTFYKSTINFVTPDVFPAYPALHMTGSGVTITDCDIRYYGHFLPIVFDGAIIEGGAQDQIPFGTALMRNMGCVNGYVNPDSDILGVVRANACRSLAGGASKFVDYNEYIQGKQISLQPTDFNSAALFAVDNQSQSTSTFAVAYNIAVVTPPNSNDLKTVVPGRLVVDILTNTVLGIVDSVGVSTYTVKYVPDGITTSSAYVIGIWAPVVNFSFLGTIDHTSNVITDVDVDFGDLAELITYGSGYLKIPGFYGYRAYTQECRVVSYDVGAKTITMDRKPLHDATAYYFANNASVKNISTNSDGSGSGSTIKNDEIFPKGSYFYDNIPNTGRRVYVITGTGYFVNAPTHTKTLLN